MATQRHQLHQKAVFKAITEDATFATVLHIICLITYGHDIYDVDILELSLRLSEDYHAELSDHNENKLNAILLATSTNIFYEQPDAFQSICSTLVEGDPGLGLLPDLTVLDVLAGVYEVELNHGPHQFRPAVGKLIQQAMEAEADANEDGSPGEGAYIQAALSDRRSDLYHQLEAIGVLHPALPHVNPPSPPQPILQAGSLLPAPLA